MATNQTSPNRVQFMLRALRHRNYKLFFGGQIVSLVGNWMTQIAMAWLVYKLTGSALMLGVVGFAGQIPAFLLGPFAGVIVDRLPRHRLLVITQFAAMIQSGILAILTLTGAVTVPHILVLIVIQGVINRLRYSGAPGVCGRNGRGQRRPEQRHRAQLFDV